MSGARPRVVHVTTTDISLDWLLGNQLEAFAAAGYDVIGVSAPGPFVSSLEERGIRHVPLRHATRSFAPLEDAQARRPTTTGNTRSRLIGVSFAFVNNTRIQVLRPAVRARERRSLLRARCKIRS